MRKPKFTAIIVTLAGCAVVVASGATSFFVIGSTVERGDLTSIRATQYTSADQLVGESDTIVEGIVVSASETTDASIPATDLVFKIETVYRGEETLPSEIIVTQHGNEKYQPEYPLLKAGDRYLLFLQLSKTSPSSSKVYYYITGVWAGVYNAEGGDYVRNWSDLDRLPEAISSSVLKSLVLKAEEAG